VAANVAKCTNRINPPDIENALKDIRSKDETRQLAGKHYLICKFSALIGKTINNLHIEINADNFEDYQQSGKLGILNAITTYNYTSSFSTYVYYKIRTELQKLRENSYPVSISRYLYKKGCRASFNNCSPEKGYVEEVAPNILSEELSEKISNALRSLNHQFPADYCTIFSSYFFLDATLKDLSKQYHVNAKYIIKVMLDEMKRQSLL
jgi:RNA polymerase sigma factor (sigma-70 family)